MPQRFPLTLKILDVWEPGDLGEDPYEHPDYYDQQYARMDFFKDATLGRVTLRDGSVHWVGPTNFKGGRCDCCTSFHNCSIVKYEKFELVEG